MNQATIIARVIRRGIPESFQHLLERWKMVGENSNFHRPVEVPYDAQGLSAEIGMYLLESHGISLTSCVNPKLYADLLTGKRTLGLSEKMWLSDWDSPALHGLFLPEEFFMDGLIDYAACSRLFYGREMHPDTIWLLARMEEEYTEHSISTFE